MPKMKLVQVPQPKEAFEVVERDVPQPQRGHVRVKVEACGICHSDLFVKEGLWPGISYPRVPGHEVAGSIDEVGEDVTAWRKGDRVGVGWHGGHCFQCESCRVGDFITCRDLRVTGISHDGGYGQLMIARQESLARIPQGLSSIEAAPLLCAGITTFNALRHSGAQGGDLVAIQGIGGLGHLGIQYAKKLGFHTVAIARGKDKEKLAIELGADAYIDSSSDNATETLQRMGGAQVILATVTNAQAMSALIDGLGINGKMIVVGASMEPINVTPLQLLPQRKSILGWPSGHAKDAEDTLRFSALRQIKPMVEVFPLEKAGEAYDRMMSGKARFRVVLQTTQ